MNALLASYPDLTGRHVLVTGGASGIGAVMVEAFLGQGANVSILDIADPDETLLALPAAAKALRVERCDLRDPQMIESAIASVRARFGAVEILVNNAARDDRHALEDANATLWDDLMAINLRAAHLTSRAVAPDMISMGSGAIVNLSSNAFMLGLVGYPVYATAKAGLVGLTKALARELGPHGIRVNCLAPGWVMTGRQKRLWVTPEALNDCLAAQCLKSEIMPEDIANACLFLASSASRMMSGQTLVVDGGRV
ncbi:SDR family oxidoreductase [Parvibaculum sp.]|uniref:SDR family NAD(P)-dependent oxidoreductase n=1 Tax=Parvibaculum sp. TaxID=2024848 RepID=UPI0025F500A5|nr:SDR family oxidoreductase [Parvibaculum sp.]